MTARADGMCRGAKAVAASSCVKTVSSIRQCCRSFGPPWTMRCPIASGTGILASMRSLAMRTIPSCWLGMGPLSASNSFPRESSAWHLPSLSPIASAPPESSIPIREDPMQYNPNLSEEEPLFSASTFNSGSASVMRCPAETPRSRSPAPVADFRHVVPMLADIKLMALHGRPVTRGRLVSLIVETWNSLDGVQRQLIAIEIVQHDHVKGSRGSALLPVAAYMNIVVIMPPVGQFVDHRGIAMEGEDHRLVCREQLIEILILQTMGMLGLRLQYHQIHHVDDTDADIGNVCAQQGHGSERLKRRHIAGAGHDHVGIPGIVAGPAPDTSTGGAVANRRINVEPLPLRLFPGDDQIDVVAAAQTMIRHRKQAVGIGRQIDAHDVGLFVCHMIDEARILVREAVVILAPDMRREQVIQRRDRLAPGHLLADLEPFCMLIEHRIDDVDEGFVAREKAMSSGEEIPFKPAFAQMFAQHLHDAAIDAEIDVDIFDLSHPFLAGGLVDGVQPVRRRLVRAEESEILFVEIKLHHVAQEISENPR